MAIGRGAGTEIIRSIHLEDLAGSTSRTLIFGEQHHIYTVLSIIVYADTLETAGNRIHMYLTGYDSNAGTVGTGEDIRIFLQNMNADQTFVWNDKFSFNGHQPTDFVGPMDDATKQNAIADQGGVVQKLMIKGADHANDRFDVMCTYIDQNNA
tara:strand:+ start:18 stop:476 length:459 start_codon:yes stop_codon:yes gene_type:complete